jgi:hypothetical protein
MLTLLLRVGQYGEAEAYDRLDSAASTAHNRSWITTGGPRRLVRRVLGRIGCPSLSVPTDTGRQR